MSATQINSAENDRNPFDPVAQIKSALLSSLILFCLCMFLVWDLSTLLLVLWLEAVALVTLGLPALLLISSCNRSQITFAIVGSIAVIILGIWILVPVGEDITSHIADMRPEGILGLWDAFKDPALRPSWIWSLAAFTVFREIILGLKLRQMLSSNNKYVTDMRFDVLTNSFFYDIGPSAIGIMVGLLAHTLTDSIFIGLMAVILGRAGYAIYTVIDNFEDGI